MKDWNFSQSPQRSSFNDMRTESPEMYSQHSSQNAALPSMDSIKSSLTQGVKQGFSSLVVSFSKGGGQSTPDSEVTSMWSTDSSENNFVQLESPESDLPPVDDNVEEAEEVVEDNSQSTGSFSIHNPYARDDNAEVILLSYFLHYHVLGIY
jgi:hypothetical protein